MKTQKVFVSGAGGHGKVVMDILLAAGVGNIMGFLDDNPSLKGTRILGQPVLGGAEVLKAALAAGATATAYAVALGIGDNRARARIAELCRGSGAELLTAVHPAAVVSPFAVLDAGTVVMAGAVINPAAHIGPGVIVNTGAVVEHDVLVGEYAHLSPNCSLGGGARVGAFASLGMGASILPGISVGAGSIVGAGAVVVRDLPAGVVAVGVPARISRQIAPAGVQGGHSVARGEGS